MKALMKIALGFLLLVSAAAATGNNNCVTVNVYAETVGDSITGANLAQIVDATSFVAGSYNDVQQYIGPDIKDMAEVTDEDGYGLFADGNCITGSGKPTSLIQRADLVGNASGSYNCIEQQVNDLDAIDNSITSSNMTQWSTMNADAIGCYNDLGQYTESDAYENCLTLSDMKQIGNFDICAVGSYNCVDQDLCQEANGNSATLSNLWQQSAKVADILGCCNKVYQCNNLQLANDNCLTGSLLDQMICESAQVTGTGNEIDQGPCQIETAACGNSLTNSQMLQSISSRALVEGCDNYINHNVYLSSNDNCVTNGKVTQMSIINSND